MRMGNRTEVIIMRGISGAGKTTFAHELASSKPKGEVQICSADDFFMKDDEYKFDAALLPLAHAECLKKFIAFVSGMFSGIVIVDNTNLDWFDVSPYYNIAKAYNADVKIRTYLVDVYDAEDRGTHGVPFEKLQLMDDRLHGSLMNMPSFLKKCHEVVQRPPIRYKVVRMFQYYDDRPVIAENLSIKQAKAFCAMADSSSTTATKPELVQLTKDKGPWFNGFTEE